MDASIDVVINGEGRMVAAGLTVSELIAQLQLASQGVAIEYNLSILSQRLWPETRLQDGDRLEIVHFVGGG